MACNRRIKKKKTAILAGEGYENFKFWYPRLRFEEEAGYQPRIDIEIMKQLEGGGLGVKHCGMTGNAEKILESQFPRQTENLGLFCRRKKSHGRATATIPRDQG